MKIHELSEKTGCAKRTIHFYIDHKLLEPTTDPENGYFQFSEEDEQCLRLILKLRELDLPLADIKEILHYPGFAGYYMQRHFTRLEKELQNLQDRCNFCKEYMEDMIPVNDLSVVNEQLQRYSPKQPESTGMTRRADARMLCLFLYTTYMEPIQDEYHSYLFEKLIRNIEAELDGSLKTVHEIFSLAPIQYMQREMELKRARILYMASLNEETRKDCTDSILNSLEQLTKNKKQIELWNHYYVSFFLPTLAFTRNNRNTLLPLCPLLDSSYNENEYLCCKEAYERLCTERSELHQMLLSSLSIDLTRNNYVELITLITNVQEDFALLRHIHWNC